MKIEASDDQIKAFCAENQDVIDRAEALAGPEKDYVGMLIMYQFWFERWKENKNEARDSIIRELSKIEKVKEMEKRHGG